MPRITSGVNRSIKEFVVAVGGVEVPSVEVAVSIGNKSLIDGDEVGASSMVEDDVTMIGGGETIAVVVATGSDVVGSVTMSRNDVVVGTMFGSERVVDAIVSGVGCGVGTSGCTGGVGVGGSVTTGAGGTITSEEVGSVNDGVDVGSSGEINVPSPVRLVEVEPAIWMNAAFPVLKLSNGAFCARSSVIACVSASHPVDVTAVAKICARFIS